MQFRLRSIGGESKQILASPESPNAKVSVNYDWTQVKMLQTEIVQYFSVVLCRCELNLLRNLIYRPAGIAYNGTTRIYDHSASRLINRIHGSVFSVERMSLWHKLEKHHSCVNCLNFNRAGNLLVSGSDDLRVIVWDFAKKIPVCTLLSGHTSNVFQTKFLDNGRYDNQSGFSLLTSARDGEVRQITVGPSGDVKTRGLARHLRPVHKIVVPDPCPNEVLTAGEDAQVMRIDLRDKIPEKLLVLRSDSSKVPLYSIAAHPFDPEFCISGCDKYVRVYDKRNVKECARQFAPSTLNQVSLLCLNSSGQGSLMSHNSYFSIEIGQCDYHLCGLQLPWHGNFGLVQ